MQFFATGLAIAIHLFEHPIGRADRFSLSDSPVAIAIDLFGVALGIQDASRR